MDHYAGELDVAPEPVLEEEELAEPDGTDARYDIELGTVGPLLAEPGAQPLDGGGGFKPSNIWTGTKKFLADAIQEKFWRGKVFLATRPQVDDPTWWQ